VREDWYINRGRPHCHSCDLAITADQAYKSALIDDDQEPAGFRRIDLCLRCKDTQPPRHESEIWWLTRVPTAKEDTQPKFDLDMARNLLLRLADTDQPRRLNLRYVLGLYLMRRRKLKFEDRQTLEDGTIIITARLTGSDTKVDLLEVQLDPEATETAQQDLLALFDTSAPVSAKTAEQAPPD